MFWAFCFEQGYLAQDGEAIQLSQQEKPKRLNEVNPVNSFSIFFV
jgi:hypothetical protein